MRAVELCGNIAPTLLGPLLWPITVIGGGTPLYVRLVTRGTRAAQDAPIGSTDNTSQVHISAYTLCHLVQGRHFVSRPLCKIPRPGTVRTCEMRSGHSSCWPTALERDGRGCSA